MMLIWERVDKVLSELLGRNVDEWDRNTCLREKTGLDLDPLDMVELAMHLEEEFALEFPEFEEDPGIETVGDVVDLIEHVIASRSKQALFG